MLDTDWAVAAESVCAPSDSFRYVVEYLDVIAMLFSKVTVAKIPACDGVMPQKTNAVAKDAMNGLQCLRSCELDTTQRRDTRT